jgi:hypothetical protein
MIAGTKTTFEMDMSHFNKVLEKYSHLTSKSMVETVNHRAANIVFKAIKLTPKTTPSQVRTDMQNSARIAPRAPLAAILTNYHRGQKGKRGLTGRAMKKSVQRAIRYRSKGTNFMKAAWYGALDDLKPYTARIRRTPRNKAGFTTKGKARAERNLNTKKPYATVEHGVAFGSEVKPAKRALSKALREEVRDMAAYIRKKMGVDWKRTKTFQ